MKNEPVAYFRKNYDGDWVEAEAGYEDESIPLYTHPHSDKSVKAKTLTDIGYETVFDGENYTTKLVEPQLKTLPDEEIDFIWAEMSEQCDEEFIDMKQFARAILRKAQEK